MNKLKNLVLSLGSGTDYSQFDTILQRNKNLEICAIYDSNIKEIPSQIFNLEKLSELVLCNCCLENVDSSIIRNKKLKILMLNGNRLTKLPDEIKELKDNLEELDLRENPIPVEEQERIKKWLPKTKIYFD